MTAQTDDINAVNLSYPSDDGVSSGNSTSAVTDNQTSPTPTSPTTPPPAQTIDDLDPNRGQQISGPAFDSQSNPSDTPPLPMDTPLTPSPENMSGSMGDMVAPSPVDEQINPDPSNMSSVIAPDDTTSTENMPPVIENQVPMATDSTPEVNTEPSMVEEEKKKESPLQSLARKLAELKSELIEETPKEEKDEVKSNEVVGTEVPMVNETPLEQPSLETPGSVVEGGVDSTQTSTPSPETVQPNLDGPAVPVTPLDTNMDSIMPTLDVALEQPLETDLPVGEVTQTLDTPLDNPLDVTPETVLETPLEVGGNGEGSEESVEAQTIDLGVSPDLNTSETSEVAAQESTQPQEVEQIPVDPLAEFQSSQEQTVSEPTPVVSEVSPDAMQQETTTTENTLETPTVDQVAPSLETPVNEGTGVIDENIISDVSTENIDASTAGGGKYPMNINKILDLAVERNASDVHITVGYPVMLRVDGSLVELHEQVVSAENADELILPLLTDQKKELLEVNREVDLAHTHRHGGEARFRINAFFTKQNLSAALRLIPTRIKTLEELQLPPIYSQFAGLKQGLILITGPTGHGKSTTLAAILQHINNNRATHILTIEDPIEYIFPKSKAVVDQREMHDDTHSWNVALKSALRQDPDVILVGEMRDYETIAATITLAETGHLVFATLHTNSASQTIDRIIDVFPENQQSQVRSQLSNILEAVVAQRLLPIDGGGRRAVSEILLGNSAVKNLIREGKTHQIDNVIRTSADIGMVSLEHSLVKLVREGLITMDKAQDYAVHPEEVVRLLKS